MKKIVNNNNLSMYKPSFSKYEFSARMTKLYNIINKENLDSVILFSPCLLYYFTGLMGSSFYIPQFLFYNKNKEIFLILREMDAQAAFSTTYLTPNEVLVYPDNYIENEELHPIQLFNFIKITDKIGLELNGSNSIAKYYLEFQKLSQNIIDITYQTNLIRIKKSQNELNYIRKAATIADKSIQLGIKNIKEGNTTANIAGKIIENQLSNGGTSIAIQPMLMVNEKAGHMNWTNQKLKKGQIISIEVAGSFLHYHCPISRTVFIGNKEDLKNSIYKDIYKVENCLNEAIIEILNTIKPGTRSKYIANIFNTITKKYNIIKTSRIGYSFGIGFPPNWGENTLSIRPIDKTIIEEGMCIHFIFGVGDSWGYQFSEAIIVTASGPELLLKTPRILFTDENKTFDIHSNNDPYISAIYKFTKSFHKKYKNWEYSIINGPTIPTQGDYPAQDVNLFHKNTPKTKLHQIEINKTKVLVKDESTRLNSKSFKILGVSYAVHKLIEQGKIINGSVLTSMTDGNHGNALAIVGKQHGLKVVIYVPKNTIEERINNIKQNEAEVIIIDGSYDDAVKHVEEIAKKNKWILISDQAWPDYEDIPQYIMNGYTILFKEALEEAEKNSTIPTHIITQTGVGGLTAACVLFAKKWYKERNLPCTFISVEAHDANCFEENILNICNNNPNNISQLIPSKRNINSIMAGLNCGIPSSITWPIIRDNIDFHITVGDAWAIRATKILNNKGINSGESGAAGFAGLLAIQENPSKSPPKSPPKNPTKKINLTNDSIVLIINTEGVTDTLLYNKIMKNE